MNRRPSTQAISCDLHDHLEVACLYRYELEVVRRDGQTIRGRASDTRTSADSIEYLVLSTGAGPTEIAMHEIARIAVLTPDARFQDLDFTGDAVAD